MGLTRPEPKTTAGLTHPSVVFMCFPIHGRRLLNMATTEPMAMDKGTVKQILSRLGRLEKAVFGDVGEKLPSRKKQNFSGPAGGARLLISRGFFKVKRFVGDVRQSSRQGWLSLRGRASPDCNE